MLEYDAIISKIYGSFYQILLKHDRKFYLSRLKGNLRKIYKNNEERHPFAIGDKVKVQESNSEFFITDKIKRKNHLIRMDKVGNKQVLCANLDQIFIITSPKEPETKFGFIDRCLSAASITNIKPILIVNKTDLQPIEQIKEKFHIYENIGIKTIFLSCQTSINLEKIYNLLSNKVTYFVGNSGVGKSTLLNLIYKKEIQKVLSISSSSKKGKHTTTNSSMFLINENTVVIDSPGIKEWGVLHLTKEEILRSFKELEFKIHSWKSKGYFNSKDFFLNNEEIKENLNTERYNSYISMIQSFKQSYRTTKKQLLKQIYFE